MGWRRDIAVLILARNGICLKERVDDPYTIDDLAVLHIFREHSLATGAPRGMDDERIPIRDVVKAVQIDCG